ncbi:MAG: biotin/lipoyl-binding protein, partial [Betaproteobacteria bacterium]
MSNTEQQSAVPAPAVAASKRRPALLAVAGVTLLAGLAYVGGTVLAILADDTDIVKAGQPLVKLDPADAQLALERAQAQLAQTVREVRTMYATNGTLAANIRLREAEVARMQSDVTRANDDVNRRQPLVATGAVAGEEMKHTENA